jgi:5-methylcytosine-specific restriction endonuclease McrA
MIDTKRKSFIISTLRRASYRWGPRYEIVKRARIERGVYLCNVCKNKVRSKDKQVDHISPVVPLTGWDSWEGFLDRLFCEVDNLQVICKTCHTIKCDLEREERKKYKASSSIEDKPPRKKYVRKTKKSAPKK